MGGDDVFQRLVLVEPGDAPGDLADFPGGTAVHLGYLAKRAAEPEAIVVGDHRRAGMGIALEDVTENAVALVPGKIEVDVGRILSLRIEKTLEQESRGERVDVGNAERVGDDRVGDGAAAA